MRHYKDPKAQAFYLRLRSLGSVQALLDAGIFGGIRSAFQAGIEGRPLERAAARRSLMWYAYYAGRDCRMGDTA